MRDDRTGNPTQAQSDQISIQTAITSINNIAATTQFGNKALLDGSAGISAAVTNSSVIGGINIGGNFAGGVTQAGNVTITVVNAATRATASGGTAATYSSVNASLASVNGTTTGVSAAATSGNGSISLTLTQANYGANYRITTSESARLIFGTTGTNVAGANATVTVKAATLISGTVSYATVTFSGGRGSSDSGLRVTDTYGNSILLTEAGNTTATVNSTVGSVTSNPVTFQIGFAIGQTTSLTLTNVFPSQLGQAPSPGRTSRQ